MQDAIHLAAGLGDIVLLAEFVDLLRRDQHELGLLDAITDLLRRLRQQVVKLGVKDWHLRMGLQEGKAVLTVPDNGAIDFQPELSTPNGNHLG
jgi:hypothetical protein